MNLLVISVVLAVVCAIVDHLFGIGDPWKKIIYAGVCVLFVIGLILLLVPGVLDYRLR